MGAKPPGTEIDKRKMKRLLATIDSISEQSGRVVSWLPVFLVLTLAYETTMRYVFNAATIWAHLTATMIGGSIILLGLAYTDLHKRHTRIDVIYSRIPDRGKALVDVIGAFVFLLPVLIALIGISFTKMSASWATGEVRIESYWYPPAAPFRTVYFIGISLYTLQCIAKFLRDLSALVDKRNRL